VRAGLSAGQGVRQTQVRVCVPDRSMTETDRGVRQTVPACWSPESEPRSCLGTMSPLAPLEPVWPCGCRYSAGMRRGFRLIGRTPIQRIPFTSTAPAYAQPPTDSPRPAPHGGRRAAHAVTQSSLSAAEPAARHVNATETRFSGSSCASVAGCIHRLGLRVGRHPKVGRLLECERAPGTPRAFERFTG
jgi:hypothetical protein